MLGVGISELVLICVIALIFVPTDDLPKLMRELGRRYGQLRRAADELRQAFVLEADRQDAEERIARMRARREQARVEREQALEAAGPGVVPHERPLPGVEGLEPADPDLPVDLELRDDPELPAPRRAAAGGEADDR